MLTGQRPAADLIAFFERELDKRNEASAAFFPCEAPRLARAARSMAERFLRGGRLIAFGTGPYATDAQHVSVEFVHPVLVGKRALPALDVSIAFAAWTGAIAGPDDIVLGFGPPQGDAAVSAALGRAQALGAMTIALPGAHADYAVSAPHRDPHVFQELFETLTHALYESVHVFLEHREFGRPQSASDFLYPFLNAQPEGPAALEADVERSILAKAADASRLRSVLKREQLPGIARAVTAIQNELDAGGKLLFFGNGGSATDANDWALDCVFADGESGVLPAISLSMEPACITAIANDVGTDVIFLRQLIAQARPHDVAVALSTSGGSVNVLMALAEARKRGMLTVALLGYDGGRIVREQLADHTVVVRSDYIPRIQEAQAAVYHLMRRALRAGSRHGA